MNWDGRPVLVTGGASFIGSHLVDKLVELSASVTVVDDLSNGKKENLADTNELQENSLKGKIALIEYKGMEVSLGMEVPEFKEFGVVLSEKDFQMLSPELGKQYIASWSMEDVHVFQDLLFES